MATASARRLPPRVLAQCPKVAIIEPNRHEIATCLINTLLLTLRRSLFKTRPSFNPVVAIEVTANPRPEKGSETEGLRPHMPNRASKPDYWLASGGCVFLEGAA